MASNCTRCYAKTDDIKRIGYARLCPTCYKSVIAVNPSFGKEE